MSSTFKTLLAASLTVWTASLVAQPFSLVAQPFRAAEGVQKTTNDGVYSKAQADGAKARFDKICAECHAFTVAAKKKPKDLPLGDEPFVQDWDGRALGELITTIVLTMPNDGSAVVSDPEAVDLVAYILQQNGFPAGSAPLTKEGASDVVFRARK